FIITVLSSTVIAAIISGFISLQINKKELKVKLKLEQNNKWIENINKSYNDYINSTIQYMDDLMAFSIKKVDEDHVVKSLNEINKTHNVLSFFMQQSEYSLSSVKNVEEYMENNIRILNEQREEVMKFLRNKLEISVLKEKMGEAENELGENNNRLSEKLGIMVRVQNEEMTKDIIKQPLIGKIFDFKR